MIRPKKDQARILSVAAHIFVAFRSRLEAETDVVTLTKSYAAELMSSEHSIERIEKVIGRFARGMVPGRNNSFAPTLAELFAELDRHADADREHTRLVSPRLAPPPPKDPKAGMSPTEIALSNARVDRMTAALRAGGHSSDDIADLKARKAEFMSRLREKQTQRIIAHAERDGRDPYDASGTFPVSNELLRLATLPTPEGEHDNGF